MRNITTALILLLCTAVSAQHIAKRALFIGNSYTYVNDLPQMVADAAVSAGDTLFFDSNSIGGYTFQQHSVNATTLSKIAAGNWDYVILQEQSQYPSFPIAQVEAEVFPYAKMLDSTINANNPCAETVFFMTWGRKNGDASNCAVWPPVCTYQGMDSLLNLRYRMMADSNDAILSPVGAVWHYIRQNYPAIELYNADESHPSIAGSYAAACCFYAVMFRKDPTSITYTSTLNATDAQNIRNAAKLIVYDSLMNWHIGEYDPAADFSYSVSGENQITFLNNSTYADSYTWNFGDGNTSAEPGPVHVYPGTGSYTVSLIAAHCGMADTAVIEINVIPMGIDQQMNAQQLSWRIYPNPVTSVVSIEINEPGNFYYRISSLAGANIQSGTINSKDNQIDISSLADGFYIFHLYQGQNLAGREKLIKISGQ
ncbi:MAG TPA: PKD domain-containing protein [Bacteroidales bacterium]|nr:PKD domain-containing protein [Bacteroidales bacterium]